MSGTKKLPIYNSCFELVKIVTERVRHFKRDYRPTLGRRMQDQAVSLILYVYQANAAERKSDHIEKILENAQVLDMLLQTAFDLKLINQEAYAETMDLTESIINQARRWQRWAKNSNVGG